MLNEHFFDCLHRQIRVNGFAAERHKAFKSLYKLPICHAFLFDQPQNTSGKIWNDRFELVNSAFPTLEGRLLIPKEGFKYFNKTTRLSDVLIENLVAILVKDGTIW